MSLDHLLEDPDAFETVRDQIGAILALEVSAQKAFATLASKDPRLWDLRVFIERSAPWEFFQDDQAQIDARPIVAVYYDGDTADESSSNPYGRQKHSANYNIDCYGYGVAAEDADYDTHLTGDQIAALEAHRAMRLVRQILINDKYAYLGMQGTVFRRWPASRSVFQPQIDNRTVSHVVAARLVLQVEFDESGPVCTPTAIEQLNIFGKRQDTGEIIFEQQYWDE